jgi:osmoprotectant transport system ATP-binding protein
VITLADVSKRYDGKLALAPTTLTVAAEQCLALIGPSGCGKSTLLRLVVGLIEPDTGQIAIGGTPMTRATARELRLRLGYVIQDGGLFPHLTAAQNVTLMAHHLRWDTARVQNRLSELAELTQLPLKWLERYPVQLSGGQRQRIGLMRALMLDPEVLLMDEPLGALDPIIRSQLQVDLKRIFQRLKKTVLLVTHDMGEAAYLGDEIALMRDGRVLQRGSVRDLLDRPADPFVVEFIRAQRPLWTASDGDPAMTEAAR